MRRDRYLAIKLRKRGVSYNQISRKLGIPKSTLSYWFKNEKWSEKIKEGLSEKTAKQLKIMARTNRKRWARWREMYRKEAKKEFKFLKENPLFIAGINLYWGEGDKKLENGQVKLVNTDPGIISIFVKFLRDMAKVPEYRIFAWMILYPNLSEEKCKSFWSKISGIPTRRFAKTQFIKGKHPKKKVKYGMCVVQVNSRGLKEKIFTWINLFHHKIMRV